MKDANLNGREQDREKYLVRSIEELNELYGAVNEVSIFKVKDRLDDNAKKFIESSPFVVLATTNSDSELDCSPRGDRAGAVRILDEKTLLLPDRRGNNRTDSLKNILENPNVALIFFVPKINETFRVGGTAQISVAPDLLEQFSVEGKMPKTVLIITIREAFVHCSRALVRSDFWHPGKHDSWKDVPTMGKILAANMNGNLDADEYDRELPERVRKTLY